MWIIPLFIFSLFSPPVFAATPIIKATLPDQTTIKTNDQISISYYLINSFGRRVSPPQVLYPFTYIQIQLALARKKKLDPT